LSASKVIEESDSTKNASKDGSIVEENCGDEEKEDGKRYTQHLYTQPVKQIQQQQPPLPPPSSKPGPSTAIPQAGMHTGRKGVSSSEESSFLDAAFFFVDVLPSLFLHLCFVFRVESASESAFSPMLSATSSLSAPRFLLAPVFS